MELITNNLNVIYTRAMLAYTYFTAFNAVLFGKLRIECEYTPKTKK